jgi:hypothetical protein
VINNNTYWTNPGVSMAHIINGAAGNIESHSTLGSDPLLNITTYLDQTNFGFGGLTVHNATALSWSYIHGSDGSKGDELTLLKRDSKGTCGSSSSSSAATSVATATSASQSAGATTITEVVTSYTTYCPGSTVFTAGSSTYTVTQASIFQHLLLVHHWNIINQFFFRPLPSLSPIALAPLPIPSRMEPQCQFTLPGNMNHTNNVNLALLRALPPPRPVRPSQQLVLLWLGTAHWLPEE